MSLIFILLLHSFHICLPLSSFLSSLLFPGCSTCFLRSHTPGHSLSRNWSPSCPVFHPSPANYLPLTRRGWEAVRWCLFTFCEFVNVPSFRGSFRHLLLQVIVEVMVVNVGVIGSGGFSVCVVWCMYHNPKLSPLSLFLLPCTESSLRCPESSLQQLALLSQFHSYCLPHTSLWFNSSHLSLTLLFLSPLVSISLSLFTPCHSSVHIPCTSHSPPTPVQLLHLLTSSHTPFARLLPSCPIPPSHHMATSVLISIVNCFEEVTRSGQAA